MPCYAWNALLEQPWKIMSIGNREWAHGFGSPGVGVRALAGSEDRMRDREGADEVLGAIHTSVAALFELLP